MTDSGSNGWNGNILGFKQNGTFVGTFGDTFTKGASGGRLSFTLVSNIPAQIAVRQLGNKTNEIGFVVKALNGSLIYQKTAGATFTNDAIFTGFCPATGCPNSLELIITMTDAYGDGWNSNILAIRQGGIIVGTFGSRFMSGNLTNTATFIVQGNLEVQVVVSNLGTWTQEIGFVIRAFNGTVIYNRTNGTAFTAGTIFKTFCPVNGCARSSFTTLSVRMTDSGSDGWNSNSLAVMQNSSVVGVIGDYFKAGASSGPISIIVQGNLPVSITVNQLGNKTNEVGFVVKAANGTILLQRAAGKTFDQYRTFGFFCPLANCTNILALTITMTDSGSDGWNGNILAIKQNNSVVGTFGETFTSGAKGVSLIINVIGDFPT